MAKKLLSSSEIIPLLETVEKDLPHLADTNDDEEDLKDESASSTPRSASSYLFTSNIVLVMVTNATTLEEQITNSQITKLMNKVDNANVSRVMGKQVEVHDKEKPSIKEFQVSFDRLIPVDQLKKFIMGIMKDKFDGSSKSSLTYAKSYTRRIDNLEITVGYQPSKFQQFDGKSNPKQHVAHFIKTYNDAGTYGDYLANSIDSWEQLEQEFINRFYSTRQTVSMIKLMNSHQWKEEPVIEYINRWRNLSLNCKDRLLEASTIEICIQGIHWGLRYILQGIQPRMFEELATRAHNMELSMAASGVEGPPIQEPQRSK
ncbi:hypothetical protein Pfo_001895 [Paulownia fortunei]|nr:hypothetical protein Pfo_001895 [Paulownia fortunei]